MTLFIQKAIILALPIVLLMVAAEYFVRKVPNDYSFKNKYLYNNSKNIEILVLGSSHSLYGINPEYFSQSAFNAAHVSQSLKYDYFIFNKFKNELLNLKYLIVPISYFTLFYQLEDGIEDWRIKRYSIYYDCQYHNDLKYNYEIVGAKPFEVLKNVSKYFKGLNNITVSDLGLGLKYTNEKQLDLVDTGITAAKRHTMTHLDLLDDNIGSLKKLIVESYAMGIKIVLFTPPARESYISNLNKHQLSVMKSNIAAVTREYPNVEYYDFMKDIQFVDDDFRDADHLNGVGAAKLTLLIDRLIVDKQKLVNL